MKNSIAMECLHRTIVLAGGDNFVMVWKRMHAVLPLIKLLGNDTLLWLSLPISATLEC